MWNMGLANGNGSGVHSGVQVAALNEKRIQRSHGWFARRHRPGNPRQPRSLAGDHGWVEARAAPRSRRSAPEEASDFESFSVSLKRYPDMDLFAVSVDRYPDTQP